MEAFETSSLLDNLLDSYPEATDIALIGSAGSEIAKATIARLWLSEGIPFAFKELPALYDVVRSWLGGRLNIDPKEINITGSARIGQSLAPRKLGKSFGSHSDIDFFTISPDLFSKVNTDFQTWSYEFEAGKIVPRNNREKGFWRSNLSRGIKNLEKGFLDSTLVPNYTQYPTIQNINQSMWLLTRKLEITNKAPKTKEASIRCYKDWRSFVNQTTLSLSNIN